MIEISSIDLRFLIKLLSRIVSCRIRLFFIRIWAPALIGRRYVQVLAAYGHLCPLWRASPAISGSGGAARLPARALPSRDLPSPTPEWARATFPALALKKSLFSKLPIILDLESEKRNST